MMQCRIRALGGVLYVNAAEATLNDEHAGTWQTRKSHLLAQQAADLGKVDQGSLGS